MDEVAEVTVKLFASLKDVFGQRQIGAQLEGRHDAVQVLGSICACREQEQALFDSGRVLRGDLVVLVNGRHLQHLGGAQTVLNSGDVISLFPPIYGG